MRLGRFCCLILLTILWPRSDARGQAVVVTNTYFVASGAYVSAVNGLYVFQDSPPYHGVWINTNSLVECVEGSGRWTFEGIANQSAYYFDGDWYTNPPATGWSGIDQAPLLTYYQSFVTNFVYTNSLPNYNTPQKISTLPQVTSSAGVSIVCNVTNAGTGTNYTGLIPYANLGLVGTATNVLLNPYDATLVVHTNAAGNWSIAANTNVLAILGGPAVFSSVTLGTGLSVSNLGEGDIAPSNLWTGAFAGDASRLVNQNVASFAAGNQSPSNLWVGAFLGNGQALTNQAFVRGLAGVNGAVIQTVTNADGSLTSTITITSGGASLYVALQTNVSTVQFTNTPRYVVGSAPSFASGSFDYVTSGGGTDPTAPNPEVDWSADGGVTWNNGSQQSTNVPVIVSVYDATTYSTALASNLTVYSYLNNSSVGQTNDFANQTVLVDQTTNSRSVVNLAGATALAQGAAALWAQYPAAVTANLNNHGASFNNVWSVTSTGSGLAFTGNAAAALSLAPANGAGANAVIKAFAVAGGVASFTVQAAASGAPVILWEPSLLLDSWTVLAQTTNYYAGGFWYCTAALPGANPVFFKAQAAAAAVTPAMLDLAAALRFEMASNLPSAAFIGGAAGVTNHVLYNVNGALVDCWASGTNVYSKQLAP